MCSGGAFLARLRQIDQHTTKETKPKAEKAKPGKSQAEKRKSVGGAPPSSKRTKKSPPNNDRSINPRALPGSDVSEVTQKTAKWLLSAASPPLSKEVISQFPAGLAAGLMSFQREGVRFALARGGRALVGDDMGLGKTIQAIAISCAYRDQWPVLVVVPNSMRLVWADELEKWVPDLAPGAVAVIKHGTDVQPLHSPNVAFIIVTYGLLTRSGHVATKLLGSKYKVVIADESHYFKNRDAQRTKAMQAMLANAEHRILLSGTPALGRPVELFTQISSIEPKLLGTYNQFVKRFCDAKQTPFGLDVNGASNLPELHQLLSKVMVRRLKCDVLTQLPPKRRQRIQIEVGSAAASELSEIQQQLRDAGDDKRMRNQAFAQLHKASSKAKQPAVCEYIKQVLEGGTKCLVFGHHLEMLDAIETVAAQLKVNWIRIDGSVPTAERHAAVSRFQSDDTIRIAVLGILAAGVGLTLTAASTVIFAELHWTPGVLVQAEDRAHRIGQNNSVNVHYLLAPGSIDDIIWPVVARKVEVLSSALNGSKSKLNVDKINLAAAHAELAGAEEQSLEEVLKEAQRNQQTATKAKNLHSFFQRPPPAAAPAWACEQCGLPNKHEHLKCVSCESARPDSVAEAPVVESWGCAKCTLINSGAKQACEVCGAARVCSTPVAPAQRGSTNSTLSKAKQGNSAEQCSDTTSLTTVRARHNEVRQ